MSRDASATILYKQFRELTNPKTALPSFHIELKNDNIYEWKVGMMVLNSESIYYGGYFLTEMKFPLDFPFNPPTFRFVRPFYHPNVYPRDGSVCISILHPGVDEASGEPDSERWTPAQSVESVLVSILSLLEDPNPDSPANVDASVAWRQNREKYNQRAKRLTEISKADIPEGFVMPTATAPAPPAPKEDTIDEDFWFEDNEEDFDDDENLEDDDDEDGDTADFGVSDDDDDDMDTADNKDDENSEDAKVTDSISAAAFDSDIALKTDRQIVDFNRALLTPAPESENSEMSDDVASAKFKTNPKKHALSSEL